jgi:hypothetical protein
MAVRVQIYAAVRPGEVRFTRPRQPAKSKIYATARRRGVNVEVRGLVTTQRHILSRIID